MVDVVIIVRIAIIVIVICRLHIVIFKMFFFVFLFERCKYKNIFKHSITFLHFFVINLSFRFAISELTSQKYQLTYQRHFWVGNITYQKVLGKLAKR